MTKPINDGGPAFPSLNSEMTGIDSNGVERFDTEESGGMSLRDYFAAKAMQSLVAAFPKGKDEDAVCFSAYAIADAMIKARSES